MLDLILALRGIRRNPRFAALVIGTMAIGIGANTTMYSLVRAVFLRPLPYSDPDRLVTLWERDSTNGTADRRVTPANFVDWRAQNTAFEEIGVLPNWSGPSWHFNIVGPDGAERVDGIYASSGFFRVLGARPLLGRTFGDEDDRVQGQRHAVVSYRYWRERFGEDPKVIGKTINVDTFRGGAFQVIGVMPPKFDMPHNAQLWLSLGDWGGGPMPALDTSERCCNWYTVLAKLKAAVSAKQAASELTGVARRIGQRHPTAARVTNVHITPLRETLVGGHRLTLFGLFGAVGCILLIGCANVANLFLARSIGRQREMLTRQALGATRRRIARQLVVEGLVLALAGALAGFWLSTLAQPLLTTILSGRVPLVEEAGTDWTVLAFVAALTLACGILCGLAPLANSNSTSLSNRAQTEGNTQPALAHRPGGRRDCPRRDDVDRSRSLHPDSRAACCSRYGLSHGTLADHIHRPDRGTFALAR
jgi:predicted permease